MDGRWLAWLRHFWERVSRKKRIAPTVREAVPDATPEIVVLDKPGVTHDGTTIDDAAIRFYEKQRMKHDKFVTPQGELPERQPRPRPATQEVQPRTPKPKVDPNNPPVLSEFSPAIVEQHHEDGAEVLFKLEEALGEFNFRDTILQQLERYFFYLKRMKKRDADAYHLYRQIGATILPYLATGSWHRSLDNMDKAPEHPPLSPHFNKLRPTFGCFVYGADPETEKFEQTTHDSKKDMWVPKFMYYMKYQQPPAVVQPVMGKGDVYSLTVWWDRPDKKRDYGTPQSMPIFIAEDGTVTALKLMETHWNHMGGYVRQYAGYKRRSRRHGTASIPQRVWGFPKDYVRWAEDHHDTVEHYLAGLFLDSVQQAENSQMSMIRIAVTKDNMTGVFSVNIRRTAYFFQDRDISVTQSGTRKPVFHLVRPHVRKDGTAVKMHFRGLRDFTWAGYRVHISIPGLEHIDLNELDIGMADEEFADAKAMNLEKLGAFLAEEIRKGWREGVKR